MRIAVIGAGIAGLAVAALLARAGRDVVVFDRFTEPRPLGSGLVVQPVGLAVLDRLGVGDAARALGAPIARMLGHETGGRRVLDVAYGRVPGLAMHRAALFSVLWGAMQASGARLVGGSAVVAAPVEGAARRVVTDSGESHGPFDLVVDASGAGSVLSPLRARALGYGAVWGTVPWPAATPLPRDQLTQRYRRADRMAGVLPIGRMPGGEADLAAVFWSLPVAGMEAWRATPLEAWKAEAAALWPEVAPFLAGVPDHAAMTAARYTHGTLPRPWQPALVFIGDAAHRASPQLGQGANMALLDALALAVAVERGAEDAGAAYAAMRRWHVRSYQGMSRLFTPMYQSDSRALPLLRDRVLGPLSVVPPVRGILSRLVAGDLLPPLAGERFP